MFFLLKRIRYSGLLFKRGFTSQLNVDLQIINEKIAQLKKEMSKKSVNYQDGLAKIQPFSLKILSTGFANETKSCVLISDSHCYLINCGESTSRILNSEKLGLKRINNLFLTRVEWSCIGGLNSLTIELGHDKKPLKIHSAFDFRPEFNKNRSIFEKKCILSQHDYSSGSCFEDENIKVKLIHQSLAESSYLFTLKKTTPKVLKEKLREFNLEPGPWIQDILKGNDYIKPDGSSIKANDLLDSKTSEEKHLLFLDFKNEAIFENLLKNLSEQLLNNKNTLVIHLSDNRLLKSELYFNWMKSLNECIHIVLDEKRPSVSIERVYELQAQLNLVNSSLFPLLNEQKYVPKDLKPSDEYISAECNMNILIRPEFDIDKEKVAQIDNKKYLNNLLNSIESDPKLKFEEIDPKVQEIMNQIRQQAETEITSKNDDPMENENYPKIVLLGTSSALATTYRNVSGILVQLNNQTNMLLDCGEGTKNQLGRLFESENLNKELCKIKSIFISHNHTDHHNGLYGLVMRRLEAFKDLNLTYEPLLLMFPRNLMFQITFIEKICKQGFFNLVKLIPNELLTSDYSSHNARNNIHNSIRLRIDQPYLAEDFNSNERFELTEQIKKSLNLAQIIALRVAHIPYSYALVISTNESKQFKIAYSGDCRPNSYFVENGKDCDLLIHECTFDDSRIDRALSEKHSTYTEAYEIALKMNAKNTILTHFSPRYGSYPFANHFMRPGITFGFDFMMIDTQNVKYIHDDRLNEIFKVLFREQIALNLNKSDRTHMKRKLTDEQDSLD